MDLDVFKPTFLIQIEGQELSLGHADEYIRPQEITSFVFEDNEEELDVMELTVANRGLVFTDDPLFQEGNEIVAQFGYVGKLSPVKKAVIKEIDYDFPEDGVPTIRLKAYDKGFKLSGKENQKVWQACEPSVRLSSRFATAAGTPGILYSEIAEQIAQANGLIPVVAPTVGCHLRVVQSNVSDAQFLKELAAKSRDREGDGVTGYMFYVQDDELHFHPRVLDQPPVLTLEYFTDPRGVLRSFKPSTQAQWGKGAGVETKAVGVDPRRKEAVEHRANNDTTGERTSLGKRTYLVDGNTGEGRFKEQETGRVVPSFERSEAFHEEPQQEPAKDVAEGQFNAAELQQVEATALTIGIPTLRAKQNIEMRGVGQKFSGVYYARSLRHTFGEDGYSCELTLRKNALGEGAGARSDASKGKQNG